MIILDNQYLFLHADTHLVHLIPKELYDKYNNIDKRYNEDKVNELIEEMIKYPVVFKIDIISQTL